MKQNYSENLKHEEPFQYFVPKIKELHELELAGVCLRKTFACIFRYFHGNSDSHLFYVNQMKKNFSPS